MSVSYFDVTAPVFIRQLESLKHFLNKGILHAKESNVSESDFLSSRLAPDMFPLLRQIQITTDNAKGAVARLAGVEPLKIDDTEETYEQLVARIDVVINYLKTFTSQQLADAGETKVTVSYFPGKYFTGHDYLVEFALPNFYFHLNMAYAIIRAIGVPLGKQDYLGAPTLLHAL